MDSIIAGKYRITSELGRGGMGMVYKAVHTTLGREDALKVLHPSLSGDTDFIRRFGREAQSMARLDHPNIVRVYDSFAAGGNYYIAMEYFDGYSLQSLIQNKKKLNLSQVLSIISQATSGLAYAHARGVIHRDIKPGNIMVNTRFRLKITDFGIAAAKRDPVKSAAAGEIFGSPSYMSPEQASGGEVDNRSDLYSLGMVFYELVTLASPFQGESAANIIKKLAYAQEELHLEFNAEVPAKVQRIIRTLLQREPNKRFPNALALQHELADAMGNEISQQAAKRKSSVDDAATQAVIDSQESRPLVSSGNSRATTWVLLAILFLVSGAYVYVNQRTILPQMMALWDFRSETEIAQEDLKFEVEHLLIHITDHQKSAVDARKKIDAVSVTGDAKVVYDEAVKVQISGETEMTEAKGHVVRAEYEQARNTLLTAESFFEEAEKQFLLAYEMVDKASSAIVVDGLIDEASLLKQEVESSKQESVSFQADSRKIAEFKRGVFYQSKADNLLQQAKSLFDHNDRLKSRVLIDKSISAYTSAEQYFEKSRRIAESMKYEDAVEKRLAELRKLRLAVTTAKIDAEHVGAATKAVNLFEKANSLHNELRTQESHIHKLIDSGRNRRAANRLDSALELAAETKLAYIKAARASQRNSSQLDMP